MVFEAARPAALSASGFSVMGDVARTARRIAPALTVLGLLGPPSAAATQSPGAETTDTVAGHPVMEDLSGEPDVLEVELTAASERLELRPGSETDVYAYNGRVPGPLLLAEEGDSVVVHFTNELPEETTVHWHGIHLPARFDGSPLGAVPPGETYTYTFRLKPGSAGTYWYHPHPHHRTAWQVGMGLYGGIIVRDPDDPLPEGLEDKLLILSDNRFDEDGELDFAEEGTPQARVDERNGREGDVLFVNDEIMPTIPLRSGEVQRWRVVNASGARIYRLSLEGHDLLHAGSDGGLFEESLERDELTLANGDRAELLVRGRGEPGESTVLRSLPYDRYMPQFRPDDWDEPLELLRLEYTDEPPVEPVALPETLRSVPALDAAEAIDEFRLIRMSQGKINSKTMDIDRVDEVAERGTIEVWEVKNLVGMDHPFHIHGIQFQVLDRNGEPVDQPRWEDTVNVPAFEEVRLLVPMDHYPGKWMFHCHNLDHEDQGMMGILEVVEPGH